MNVLLLKGRTRPIAFILAALLTFGLLSCFGVGAVPAFAVPGEFAMYESTWWVTNSRVDLFTGNRFYSVYTGSVAYCMDHGLASPTGHYYDSYEPSAEDRARMTAAMYYGYPSTTVVGGIPLSEDQARCATQLAIWALRGCLDIWDLKAMPGTPDYPNDGNAVIAAARILYDQTQGGFASPQADIALPASKGGTPYGADAVRYGPFRANKASKATAALSGAPAGAWFGSASGSRLDANNLPADADFYLYIPAAAQTQGNIRVDVAAEYSVFEVGFYTAYRSAQDVTMYVAPYSAKKEANCTLLPFGKARIDKRDSVTGGALAGAAFKVQQWNGSAFADTNISIAWNASLHRYETGFLCATETNGGRFRLVETANPYSYSGSFSQELKVAGYGNTSAYTAANTPARLRVELEKTDAGTGENAPQGDASLENAEYGIYMAENRTHPDGTVFKKDQLVKTGHTDAGGQIVFKDLFPAKYYVKEIAPSEGYLLDETAYPVDGTAGSPAKPITLSVSVNEQVVKQAFHFRKVGPVCGTDEPVPLAAGFTIYLIRDLSGVKDGTWTPADDGDGDGGDAAADGGAGDGPANTEDGGEKTSGEEAAENETGGNGSGGAGSGEETAENEAVAEPVWRGKDFAAYDFTEETPAIIDGVPTEEIFSDEAGDFTSPELPYGAYVVVESTVPEGRLVIDPIVVRIEADDREAIDLGEFVDERQVFDIEITKTDKADNTLLEGAEFGLFEVKDALPASSDSDTEENAAPAPASGESTAEQMPALKTEADKTGKADKTGETGEAEKAGETGEISETALMTAVSDENGIARFSDLPAGRYVVRETKAPEGYELDKDFAPAVTLSFDSTQTPLLLTELACADEKSPIPEIPDVPVPKQPEIKKPPLAKIIQAQTPRTGDGAARMIWILFLTMAIAGLVTTRVLWAIGKRTH